MAPKALDRVIATARTPTKTIRRRKGIIKGGGRGIRAALIKDMRSKAGWEVYAQQIAIDTAHEVPVHQRPGAPLKGGFPLDKWPEKFPDMVVDLGRSAWLPDDWGQGVKTTKPTAHSTGTGGGMLVSFISPCGRRFFHKYMVEQLAGRKLSAIDGFNGQVRRAQLQSLQNQMSAAGSDRALFQLLSPKERRMLPDAAELHVCVVSARRTRTPEGLRDIAVVQAQLTAVGIEPTWYVDGPSLEEYRALGLKAVVGGKLTAARNMALDDAARCAKACVQVSDDVSRWEYRHGARAIAKGDDATNAAHAAAKRYVLSPLAAALFMLAKLRALRGPGTGGPRLAGVYPLGSCSRAFGHDELGMHHFILGDFFVADSSPVRFDEEMTLKEDYDFTCAHIAKHGAVLRFNRMTIAAKHATNPGGAVAQRDRKGEEEKRNIAILLRKWPRAFFRHTKRKHEVILRWPGAEVQEEVEAEVEAEAQVKVRKQILKAKPASAGLGQRSRRRN